MKVISHTTLVTRSDEGRVDHKPGTAVDLPAKEAQDLIDRGIARPTGKSSPASEPLPPFDDTEKEAPGTGEPMQEVEGSVLNSGPNINIDEVETLVKIKGIGRKTANDIIASREADGPFQSLEDCANRVGGVTVNQLNAAEAVV